MNSKTSRVSPSGGWNKLNWGVVVRGLGLVEEGGCAFGPMDA
jgi:hypothetical protein